tara:strand:- start:432 stop:743 length:312 start_codon:yes stop_codon:yes gene_type:complete
MIKNEWDRLSALDKSFRDSVIAEHTGDIVDEPQHYLRWKIEPITYIMRNGFDFWRGNIIKYASRAGYKLYEGKDSVESETIDLKKVIRYAEMRINQLNGEEKL